MDELKGALVEQHFQLLAVALIFAAATFSLALWKGFFRKLEGFEKEVPLTIWDVLGAFLVYIGVPVSLGILVGLGAVFFPEEAAALSEGDPQASGWFQFVVILSITGALLFYSLRIGRGVLFDLWGFVRLKVWAQWRRDAFIGGAAWLVSFPLVMAAGQLFALLTLLVLGTEGAEQSALRQLKMVFSYPLLFGATVVSVVLIIPIAEEILFRGFLQTWFQKHMNPQWAILSTSIVFSCFHFSSSQEEGNYILLPTLFVLSYFLGFVYFRQRSLVASITLHGVFNGVSTLLMVALQSFEV